MKLHRNIKHHQMIFNSMCVSALNKKNSLGIFMKCYGNIKHHRRTCNCVTLIYIFLELFSFEI